MPVYMQHGRSKLSQVRPALLGCIGLVGLIGTGFAVAAAPAEQTMDWSTMGINLLGGLALFLFGMEQMASALKAVAGERMKLILAKLTTNRMAGAATGAFVTAIIQSSSITTVLVVGFISAGLMSMTQSIGVIMGANIGTTVTAQIIAFKVTKAALPMIAIGFGMLFFSKQEKLRQYGGMLMGLGLVFFGMSVMGQAMEPLRSYQPFLDLMVRMENPLVGILVATAFTALVQSSSATTGIVIVMASQGFITLPAGIALIFGANIGTCVTAMLAAIGKPREAIRAALVHVLFNVFGVLLWIGFISELAEAVTWMSPTHGEFSAAERLGAETPRQIANAHSLFNVINTFVFIGFATQFARLVEWLVPDRPLEEEALARPKYLEEALLETPSLALENARLEIGHLGEHVEAMVKRIMPAIVSGDRFAISSVGKIDDRVDALHGQIITYLGRISQQALTEEQTRILLGLMDAANDLEQIGDIIETDLVHLGHERIENGLSISDSTRQVLGNLHDVVLTATQRALTAVAENDASLAREAIAMKADINRLMGSAALHQAKRLVADEPNRLAAYTIEMDVIEKLRRIYYFAKRLAKTVVLELEDEAAE